MEKRDILMVILFVLVIASLMFSVYSYTINAKKISENRQTIQAFMESYIIQLKGQRDINKIVGSELGIDVNEKLKEMQAAGKASLAA